MSRKKGRRDPRPKRLFKRGPLHPALGMIADLTMGDPGQRRAMKEVMGAICDGQAGSFFDRLPPGRKAAMVSAMRAAFEDLARGKRCDFCESRAHRVRFASASCPTVAGNGDLIGFPVLCDACFGMPEAELRRKVIGKLGGRYDDLAEDPYFKRLVAGPLVGEPHRLPPRAMVRDCGKCGKAMWYDQDDREWGGDREQEVSYLCFACVEAEDVAGRLQYIDIPG